MLVRSASCASLNPPGFLDLFHMLCQVTLCGLGVYGPCTRPKEKYLSREFLWQGHTVHATKEDADKEVLEALDHYRHIYEEYFAVPVVKGMKSEKKFAGARYTTSVEKLVVVYKVQRCLTSHSQIKKEKVKGVANSWAYSAITIGVMILTYGDDKGLVNPPNVAPIQVRLSEEGNGLDVCDS
ncbi:hypothetical protein YC2023_030183 [Brassica napus]